MTLFEMIHTVAIAERDGVPLGYDPRMRPAIDAGFVTAKNGRLFLTASGSEEWEAAKRSPQISNAAAVSSWKLEALTGCDRKGRQSSMDNAAIHGQISRAPSMPRPEDMVDDVRQFSGMIKKTAERIGVTFDEALQMVGTGKIKKCASCGKVAKHSKNRNGYRNICTRCERGRRKKS